MKFAESFWWGLECLEFTPHWLVMEKEQCKSWADFNAMWQGSGGLGEKISYAYNILAERSEKVVIIGSDTPQLSSDTVVNAVKLLADYDHVIGPSTDGGFYLFASKMKKAPSFWQNVTYSSASTCEQFISELEGSLYKLPILTDIDTRDDFKNFLNEAEQNSNQRLDALKDLVESLL